MSLTVDDIVIVGLSVRFPGGTEDPKSFWNNLRGGVSSIRKLEDHALDEAGVPAYLRSRPDYVPYAAPLDRFDHFDAEFFGLSPKEASIMDPQHRVFLELSWEALEAAGHPPASFPGKVGVYAGSGMGSYFYFNVCSNPDLVDDTGMFLLRHTGNDKDFLSTRVSHALDLKGPSINIQTACSTSLVAVHYAAQALRSGDCDIALAGGSTIELPQGHGYVFKENEILSPDGQCRAFDHRAEGTVFGSGAGVVALRRMSDALADGDPILAVLKGSAINNDGADKAGYLAPSVSGQADAIRAAHAAADVPAETIDYVECHGTGTYLGDPIEVAALTEAFRDTTDAVDFCRIGSVKTNLGHLDTAAGVASLAKTALALQHGEIPPSLGFEAPNPAIDFDSSPFRVNDKLADWPERDHPRRAGVNSLGVGGTNAHVVLEEAPTRAPSEDSVWPFQLLTLSARSAAALEAAGDRLADHLDADQSTPLADVAFTLKEGRHGFEHRRVVAARSHAEAAALLRAKDPRRVFSQRTLPETPDPVFMFPGGGAQYAGMARELYATEPEFRDWMDRGLEILEPKLNEDIIALWLPKAEDIAAADERLKTPSVQLPLIMIVEYALAQLWMSWGVRPTALIGHSMGENTAACLAGVMSFEDCIGLVHLRGTLFDQVEGGGMLSVALPEAELRKELGHDLDIAAVNGPGLSVATGPVSALKSLEQRLKLADIDCHRIAINIAAHSRMLDPILEDFEAYLNSITLSPPQIPFVSNVTGTWITEAEATSPRYWVRHLRSLVRFADGIATLAKTPNRAFIEVGPGRAMAALAAQCPEVSRNQVMGSLRDPSDEVSDDLFFVTMLGRFWAMGGVFDWDQLWDGAARRRVALPTYPFQRKRYFIEPGTPAATDQAQDWLMRLEDRADWGWAPVWKPTYADCLLDVTGDLSKADPETWLIFLDQLGVGAALVKSLRAAGHRVITVEVGTAYSRFGEGSYRIATGLDGTGYGQLMTDLATRETLPTRIVHLWMLTGQSDAPTSAELQDQGFWSLFHLAQAWTSVDGGPLHMNVITSDAMRVADEPLRHPAKATVLGPLRVIPREFPDVTCSVLDVIPERRHAARALLHSVLEECLATPGQHVAALRRGKRFEQTWRSAPLEASDAPAMAEAPVILMTGGLGGIGLTLAARLVADYKARIAFVSRRSMAPRAEWSELLEQGKLSAGEAQRLRDLMALEEAGGEVMVLTGDVANRAAMVAVRDQVTETWGRINGVLHAAGVIDDAPILTKTAASIDRVLSAKVQGTDVLFDLFPDGSIDWCALFSSTSTVTAPAGQVDYVAANEYLNAVAQARQGGKTRVFAINWGVWSEVGMAANAMAARTGVPDVQPVAAPMLDGVVTEETDTRVFTARWRTSEHWVLDEHRTEAGDALLPGTGYLELAAEALTAEDLGGRFEVRDLTFLSPLRVEDTQATDVRLELKASDGRYGFRVSSSLDGQAFETNAEAELRVLPMIPPAPLNLAEIADSCPRTLTADPGETLRPAQAAHLQFGPRWQVLEEMRFGEDEGLARLRLPKGDTAYHLHPGLMDIATGWAMDLIPDYTPRQFWVPVSYHSARFFGPLPREIVSWVRYVPEASDTMVAQFDITLAAPDGVVVAEIEGFAIHRLAEGMSFAASSGRDTALRAVATPARHLSAAEERLAHNISQGIPPAEGATAFLQVLAGEAAQQVVSSLDLPSLIAQTDRAVAPAKVPGQTFERPDLDSEYIAPEGGLEICLAGFWTDLLGVDKVGANDNFFDLGGHSLIAVRFLAMVKSTYAVDFPISVLFEAPTIRTCAALIAEEVGDVEDPSPSVAETPVVARRKYLHLVPLTETAGPGLPLFMVAGMYGNVMHMRQLAGLLGGDRPVYGLQLRGVFGDYEPHHSLEEAAADYIAEMREICPEGPYLIGGYSGGAVTSIEMAHQLQAAEQDVGAVMLLDIPQPKMTRDHKIKLHLMRLRQERLAYVKRWLSRKFDARRKLKDEARHKNLDLAQAFMASVDRYKPQVWDGAVSLFRPPLEKTWELEPGLWVDSDHKYVRSDNLWGDYLSNLEITEVPGDHVSMVLEPNVRQLAVEMKAVLDKAEKDARLAKRWGSKAAE